MDAQVIPTDLTLGSHLPTSGYTAARPGFVIEDDGKPPGAEGTMGKGSWIYLGRYLGSVMCRDTGSRPPPEA